MFTVFVKEESANYPKESPKSQTNKTLDPNDPELQKRIRYTREKKEQLKALLGTSRHNSRDDTVIVTTYSTVRPSKDSAATDISEGTSSQSHLIKPSTPGEIGLSSYPYKPARCKSYIVEADPETPLLKPSSSDAKIQRVKSVPKDVDEHDVKKSQDRSNV